jgi:hypothetical protein
MDGWLVGWLVGDTVCSVLCMNPFVLNILNLVTNRSKLLFGQNIADLFEVWCTLHPIALCSCNGTETHSFRKEDNTAVYSTLCIIVCSSTSTCHLLPVFS